MKQQSVNQSNYEKVYEQFRTWFLEDDLEETAKILNLNIDEKYLYVPFFHEMCLANRSEGSIFMADGSEISVENRLTIMHHLHYYQKFAQESSKMVPFREIRESAVFEKAYQKSALEPLVKTFSGCPDKLLQAGLKLGGKQEKFGDVSVTLQAFPRVKMTYIFWDKDEEFPASANILFDDKIAQWTHGESVPVLAGIGTKKLIEAANLNI